ncbi:alpha/beta hydrolase [Novosphingobium sp.]|uniref:alpha/beta fold hydrolase n=1 Tax=Novosphingobium sp. TaxID=1874826 RepID=UPI00333E8B01
MNALPLTRIALGNGIELDVVDVGPRDAPALIFLHGFPESHRTWRHQIAHLAGRFRCIAPDQRGYRGSSKPVGVEHYAPAKMIGDVFRLADALGVERFTVIGHDWGGAIAWGVALTGQPGAAAAGRVTRAIIANAPHPAIFPRLLWTSPVQRRASQYFRTFRDPAIDADLAAHGLAPLLARVLPGPASSRMEPEERAALLADWADPAAALAMISWYRASPVMVPPLDAPYALPDSFLALPVPPLTVPTLVIWGMDDHALPPENLAGLDQHITDLSLVRIPDCGHFVPWEAPDAVNAGIDAFLATAD